MADVRRARPAVPRELLAQWRGTIVGDWRVTESHERIIRKDMHAPFVVVVLSLILGACEKRSAQRRTIGVATPLPTGDGPAQPGGHRPNRQ